MKVWLLILAMLFAIAAPAGDALAQGVYPQIPPRDIPRAQIPAPAQKLKPGDVFRDCPQCPDLVVVPPGIFVMGSEKHKREGPTRVIRVRRPFAIGRFEVTRDEWLLCVAAGACNHTPDDHGWGTERMPVINVDHRMVHNYTNWLSTVTGQTYRLPSEAEWEYAARAGSKKNYWFGDDVGENQVNCRKCGSPWSGIGSAPVGSFDPNPWGLFDMHGNAFEWVEDCWSDTHQGAPQTLAPRTDGDCRFRVIRGGSWYYFSRMSRSANRQKNPAAVKSYWLSFRVVRELR